MINNEFTLKYSFEADNRIQDILSILLMNGYKHVSLDIESIFTNVPFKKTIDITLTQTYNDYNISGNLKKCSLKNLIVDTCTKAPFSFKNIIYAWVLPLGLLKPILLR